MTPRALLTAIGATALTFAIAIGIAAESASGVQAETAQTAGSVIEASLAVQPAATDAAGRRLAAWNDPCVIAV